MNQSQQILSLRKRGHTFQSIALMVGLPTKEVKAILVSEEAADKRIEKLYYAQCSGITIPIMKIGSIFGHARAVMAQEPAISDEALGQAILDFVQVIAQEAA